MIHLCFRFDDPSPTSDHRLERDIISLFARHGIPVTVAVIPSAKDGIALRAQHVPHLIEAHDSGTIEIAQHGFSHQKRSITADGSPSEFYGLPALEQRSLLENGARVLREVFAEKPVGFVPPWNTFDANTASLLKELRYGYVSAAWEMPTPAALPAVPLTCWLHAVRGAVAEANRFSFFGPLVITVLHAYDFRESGEAQAYTSLPELDQLLQWLSGQAKVRFLRLADVVAMNRSFVFGINVHHIRARLPWRIQGMIPKYALLTSPVRRAAGPTALDPSCA